MKPYKFWKNYILKINKQSKQGETHSLPIGKSLDEGESKQLTEYECCVSCWKRTNVLVSTHIESRKYYVIGCGQLCQKCYYDLLNEYKEK